MKVFFAHNRRTNSACMLTGFRHWEMVQGAFRCGITLPDGTPATGIGRCDSVKDFMARALKSKVTIQTYDRS